MTDTRHALAERDTSKPAEKQGLFDKFKVLRRDGSSEPGEKHDGREYFVLDIDHDPHAKAALAAYADDVEATHPYLAKDMRARYALSAQPVAGAVAPTADEVRRAAFELCEFIEDIKDKPTDSQEVERFKAGQRYAAKSIRRGLGIWFVDEENSRKTAQAAPAPEPSAQAVAWMIESRFKAVSTHWWNGLPEGAGQSFTPDPNKAVRFARKEDAERVALHMHMVKVTEHVWLAASPRPAEPSAQGEPVACDRDAPVCPWCDRQGWDICQHADDARTCGK